VESSAIVAAMKLANESVSTWSIGFTQEDLGHEIVPNDLLYARKVGSLFGTEYHERILEPNVLEPFRRQSGI
jgi:asparagine synthetase B (glutamine-hydrolysing)